MKKESFDPLEINPWKMVVFIFLVLNKPSTNNPHNQCSRFFSWRNIRDEVVFHRHLSLQ